MKINMKSPTQDDTLVLIFILLSCSLIENTVPVNHFTVEKVDNETYNIIRNRDYLPHEVRIYHNDELISLFCDSGRGYEATIKGKPGDVLCSMTGINPRTLSQCKQIEMLK